MQPHLQSVHGRGRQEVTERHPVVFVLSWKRLCWLAMTMHAKCDASLVIQHSPEDDSDQVPSSVRSALPGLPCQVTYALSVDLRPVR